MPEISSTTRVRQASAAVEQLDARYAAIVGARLAMLLAETYHLVIKSHLYHWSVVEPVFGSLHELAEDHYGLLRDAADAIIDRIEDLGGETPERLALRPRFASAPLSATTISLREMVDGLVTDHQDAWQQITTIATMAANAGDAATGDLMTAQMDLHAVALRRLRGALHG